MSGSNTPKAPQAPVVDDLEGGSVDGWMSALAASPAPRPRYLPTALVLRRARLEAHLAAQRAQTRRALRPAFVAEAVGILSTAAFGVYLCGLSGEPSLFFKGLGDIAIFAGFSSSSAVITLLVMLLFLFWFVGDEPMPAG